MPFHQTGPNSIANIGTYIDINQSMDEIETLSRAHASRKDYQRKKKNPLCFEGTRVVIVGEMTEWVTNPGESRMYTLSGLAGIGKSTVAYTVATNADELGLLGASFFFTRDEIDCRTAQKFFITLTYQLCHYDEEIKQAIRSVLATKEGAAAAKGTPQEQREAFILIPLRGIAASRMQPILIVVDALDECDDEDADSVLTGLCRMVQDLPSIKVILTTRPQPLLSLVSDTAGGHKIFYLQDIEDKVVNDDIRLYIKHSLSREQVKARLPGLRNQWYASDAEIESLVRAAGKLFIIASTAVLFILDKIARNPKRQMERLLHTFSHDRGPSKYLNDFYSVIVRNALPEGCDDYDVERFRSVVGSIVVIQIPLPIMALACLLDREEEEIYGALDNLQSVILVGDDLIPRIYHKSFVDYITDPERCNYTNVQIDPTDCHMWIGTRCFETMNKHLKYNILGLDGPARLMDNEKGLAHQRISDEDVKEKISPGLRYTCIYWAIHLESANMDDAGVMKELKTFVDTHMLHWFEALSLIRRLDSAHRSIRVGLRLVTSTSSDLFQLLSDGLRFISKFYEVIERSALHTYYSALPFTPTESLLCRRYSKEAADSIFRAVVGPKEWDALLATQRHGNPKDWETHVKFSLDGTMFASWDRVSVRFWDAATGTPISMISLGHHHLVTMANDLSMVASAGDDNTLTLYNVKTSTPVATFTTSTRILEVVLTSESSRVAALLSGGTFCLWDTGKSEPIASIGGFDVVPLILEFSPTGTRLAFMPLDGGIVQLRDGITGALIANLDDIDDLSDERHELVFSNDGSLFAILTEEVLILRKSEDGKLVGFAALDAFEYTSNKLAINANGSLLATGMGSKVHLWSWNSGNLLTLIDELDLGSWIDSLAFSPDDTLASAASSSITVYNVGSRLVLSTLPIHSGSTLTFSPDGNRLAATTFDGVVHLWDVQVMRMSTKEAKHVCRLALSQSCARLACVFEDNTIELWEISSTKRITIHDGRDDLRVSSIGFSPDGKKFATIFDDGTIRFWDGENGASIKSIKYSAPFGPEGPTVALSNRMLAAGGGEVLALWDLGTLLPIVTTKLYYPKHLTFSSISDLLAFSLHNTVMVLDVLKRTVIATFNVHNHIDNLVFVSDESQLVVQLSDGDSRTFHLVNKGVKHGPTFSHLIHHRYFPLWHAVPVPKYLECYCLVGLFPQYEDPVPVLWIPKELRIVAWGQESSMITCSDGQVIFVLSPISVAEFNPDSVQAQY